MKKMMLVLTLALLAAGAFGVGAVFAQDEQPPLFAGQGSGVLHTYMTQAMADSLHLSVDEFEARCAAGETYYSIALAQGIPAQDIPALMQAARASALDAAADDGLLTQAQADWMKSRGAGRGGMRGGMGYNDGCTMAPTASGGQSGPGMMGRR